MTWQKLKKTLNILRRSACKFRTKTPRNLLGTGLGTNYFLMLKTLKTQPCFSSPHNQAKLSGHSTGPSLPRGGHHFQSFHPDFAPGLGRWHHGPSASANLCHRLGGTFGSITLSVTIPTCLRAKGSVCTHSCSSPSPRALIASELAIKRAASAMLHGCPSVSLPPTRCF